MGPRGSENLKQLLLLQIATESFSNFWFFFNGPHKITLGFLKFWNCNFNEFIALLDYNQAEGYSMGLMASHIFFFNETFSKKFLWQFSQKVTYMNFKIWNVFKKKQWRDGCRVIQFLKRWQKVM